MFSFYIWILVLGLYGTNGLSFNRLEDGIIVTRGENLSVIEGEWTLLLTIREDGIVHGLETHAELVDRAKSIWTIVNVQNTSLFLTPDRMKLMKAKVSLVINARPALTYNVSPNRSRRGILDFVGTGLNWAFGTATQAQVDALQEAVDAAGTTQHAIVHNIEELITVVNQTQRQGVDTRRKL